MIMERLLESLMRRLSRLDHAAYRKVAGMSTPLLDRPLRQVSHLANFSKPWLLVAAMLALFGGRRGRRAAATGIAAIGLTSLLVNQLMKLVRAASPPGPGRPGRPGESVGDHAVIDLISLRPLGIRGGVRGLGG
jgi:undecaprenyl-diphosphatase